MSDVETRLATMLETLGPIAVAVSGGVDSMTLASFARRRLERDQVLVIHATSPAVPAEATSRVEALAAKEDWLLRIITAGEFADPAYRANPVNRCFFCKTNLYGAIATVTGRQILSGANMDDLGEYRPGLDAARNHRVRHPYVEAGIDKAAVRALARRLGLPAIADLPSAPCLSSRIETGIRIEPAMLRFVNAVEHLVSERLDAARAGRSVRCRIRAHGIVVELDRASLALVDADARASLQAAIGAHVPLDLRDKPLSFEPYRTGSAFLTQIEGIA